MATDNSPRRKKIFGCTPAGKNVFLILVFLISSTVLGHSTLAPVEPTLPVVGVHREVVFSNYPQISSVSEVARRTLSPLANLKLSRAISAADFSAQAIDLKSERFTVYVPAKRPGAGYGLIVFIPPWEDARIPPGWDPVLNDSGVIFVSAARSGNESSIFARRIPLALLGAYNISQLYPIDVDRIYVGGFSGGSRVALRVALGYADLFQGALLNSGSDSIGNSQAVLPPDDLLIRFQTSSRIVYVTGAEDAVNINQDMGSRSSMKAWCAFRTDIEMVNRRGHEVATADSLRWALTTLDRRLPVDPVVLSGCRLKYEKAMRKGLDEVSVLLRRERPADAKALLDKVDARFGGLARQGIIDLENQFGALRSH